MDAPSDEGEVLADDDGEKRCDVHGLGLQGCLRGGCSYRVFQRPSAAASINNILYIVNKT